MKDTEGREGKQQKNVLLVRGWRTHLGKMIFVLSLLLMSILFSQNKQYPSLPLGYSIRPDQLLPRWDGKITKEARIRQFYPIQRITTDPADDIQPAWSPDGRTIVFVSNRINKRDGHDLYAINADGTNERLLAKFIVTDPWGGRFGCPNWLGNTGDIILMDYKFYWEIMRFRLSEAIRDNVLPVERAVWDGDSLYITRLIFVPPGYNPYKSPATISPISSPDGSKIAFHYDSYREGKWVVRIYENSLNGYIGSIDDVGRTVFSVSSDGAIGADFKPMAFSPDGQKLVISACETGWAQGKRRDLYVVDITSGMRYMLTNTGSQGVDHGYVSWSSQNWIAFAMRQSDESSYDLYIIRPDGTGLTRLTDTPWNEIDPSWSPDGTKLVFASDKEGNYDLYVMEILTSNRPPSVPVLLSPANNATVSPTPTFKVKSEDPDGDQVKFEIEVVKGSETKRFETGFFASGSEATFTVPENQSLSEGQWSWRARAIDNKGAASDWSDARKLIVTSAPIITFLLPISLHIGQEDHFFIVCQNITNQPWEGFAFIRIKLQNPTGIGKVAYRVWTLREENIITLAKGEIIDEITFPVEFIPPVGPNELKAFVVSIKSIQDTKIKRIEPYTTLILVGFAIYTAWKFYIARDLLETGATIELRRSVMLTFINAGYDIDPATADKIVKAIQQSLKERQEMNWIDRLQQLDFAYSVASKAYKLYEGQFPISSKDVAIGVLKKSVINFLKTADELMKTGEYIDENLKIILREHRKEIEEILRVESSQPSSKSIGPEFIKGNQPLRYIQFFKPTSNNKMRSGEITELLIINPLDPNVDVNTFAFEGVSHPAALIEQQVDIQKREARWSFRLADIGSDEVWVQFSVLPKSDLPSGTQIRNKAIMKIGNREDQTNEIITTIDNTPPKVLMQSLDPIQQFNKFPIKWMHQDDIGEVDKVEIWISDDGKEPELWAIFPSSTTTITFQGKFGHEYKFYLVAIDKAGNQSSFPEQPLAITKAGQAPLIEKGLHLITLPIFSEISDPKQIFSFEANKWAWYDPITKKYSYYPETSASTLQPGKAFWVFFTSSHVPNAKGETVNDTQPFSVPLKQGWNLVGNPWLIPLNWDLEVIKVQQSNAIKSLKDAQAAGWIEDYAWGWEQDANNPNTGRYVLVYDTSIIPGVKGQLEPWKGYWVYAHTDCELILPPPSQSKGRGTRGEGRVAKGNGWSMRLQASVNGSVGEAVLGIANGTRGLAVGLPPEPPTGNNGVQVILLKNNTPLAVDVRSDGSRRQEWEVLVRFGTRDGGRGTSERKKVVLTFDGVGYAPKDVSAWLVDTVTGKRVYLRTQPSYRFAPEVGETERRFKVIVESGNERPLRIVGLKATPMRGEGLVITFALTKPAQVRGEVMTLTGRKIAVMDDGSTRMAGTHRMIWRGVGSEGVKVPVGAYLVRLVATDEDGRQVQAVTVVRSR